MQQNQQERRFPDSRAVQPVHRFPQHQSAQGWQAQQSCPAGEAQQEPVLSSKDQRELKRAHKKQKRRRFSLVWNLLAVIGLITVLIQAARYIVVPLLVYLNVLSGGTL